MKLVAVIMSTYNGAEFLEEQIGSILQQQNVMVDIYIRDDGSLDMTNKILSCFTQSDHIHVYFEKNIGVGNSFMELLYCVPEKYDYYALSDQDDIWYPRKLIEAIEIIEYKSESLYVSNQECVDRNGNTIGIRYRINPYTDSLGIMSKNLLSGCTMVFKHKLFLLLKEQKRRPSFELLKNRMHDVWIGMVASVSDGIYYDSRSFIKYRQHENNVVGANETSKIEIIIAQFSKLLNKEERNGRSRLAFEIVEKFPEYLEQNSMLRICAQPKGVSHKYYLVLHSRELRRYTKESLIGYTAKVVLNFF